MRTGPSVLGVALGLAVCALACGPKPAVGPAQPQAAPVRVETAKVDWERVSPPIRTVGVTKIKQRTTLGFEVGGLVSQVLVHEGQVVYPGQLLASLDPLQIDAQVHKARAAVLKAQRDQARAVLLVKSNAMPRAMAEDAQTAYRLARQNLKIALFNQAHARLVAENAGRVAKRLAEPGMVVGPGTPILQVDEANQGFIVSVGVTDRDLVRVSTGDRAQVALDAFVGKRFPARVSQVAVEPSPVSGIYDVELRFVDPPPHLVSGLIAKVELDPEAGERVALVPASALVEGNGRLASVFTVGPHGRAKKLKVEIAFFLADRVAIRHGLEDVDRVVTGGAAFLSDGALVAEAQP